MTVVLLAFGLWLLLGAAFDMEPLDRLVAAVLLTLLWMATR